MGAVRACAKLEAEAPFTPSQPSVVFTEQFTVQFF